MKSILLVEDNLSLAQSIITMFSIENFKVHHFARLETVRQNLDKVSFDLALIDVELPDGSGFDLVKELRNFYPNKQIIFITARVDESDAVRGLTLGADDYIRKPFGNKELLARVHVSLKDIQPMTDIVLQDLCIKPARAMAFFMEKEVSLSKKELQILIALAKNYGLLLSREKLLIITESGANDRTIDSHISHLRSKLRNISDGRIKISSVYGFGYQLNIEGNKPSEGSEKL